jgi:hypothetical protein
MVQVLAEAARAIYWFNPMFWLACSRLRRESEHACDDAVVRMGAPGAEYAQELLDLTRALRRDERLQSPILAMAQPSHLERRLVALLNPSLNRLAATPWAVGVVALAAVALTLPLAAIRTSPPAPEPAAALQPAPTPVEARRIEPAGKAEAAPAAGAPASGKRQADAGAASAMGSVTAVPVNLPEDLPAEPAPAPAAELMLAKREIWSPNAVEPAPPQSPPAPHDAQTSRPADIAITVPPDPAPPAFTCNVTPPVRQVRTESTKSMSFGSGPWHISRDNVLWVWDQPYVAGREVNTIWMRPVDAEIAITARRLDGAAAPLRATARSEYQSGFLATGLTFPVAGCWEITATSGSSLLTFVTQVDSR